MANEPALNPELLASLNALLTTIRDELPNILTKLNEAASAAGKSADSATIIAAKLLAGQEAAGVAAEAAHTSLGVYQAVATNSETYAKQIEAIAKALKLITTELEAQKGVIPKAISAEMTQVRSLLDLRRQNLDVVKKTKDALVGVERTTRQLKAAQGEAAEEFEDEPVFLGSGSGVGAPPGARRPPKPRRRRKRRPKGKGKGGGGGGGGGGGLIPGALGDVLEQVLTKGQQTVVGQVEATEELYKNLQSYAAELASYTGLVMNMDSMVRRGVTGQQLLAQTMIDTQESVAILGIGVEGVKEGYKDMIDASYHFRSEMSKGDKAANRNIDNLASMVIVFKKLGMEGENFGKVVDIISKTYGRTDVVLKTKQFGTELMHLARATGQIPKNVVDDYTKFMEGIGSAYSFEKAQNIFKRLSATAAETGVSTDKMLAGMKKFDDIDAAAEAVGELNAMLGGPYLNTLDLVRADEATRIELMRDAAKAANVNFESLNKFGRLAIGEKAGFESTQDAMRILRGRSKQEAADWAQRRTRLNSEGATYEELFGTMEDGAARNAVSITKQFSAAQESLLLTTKAYKVVEKGAAAVAQTLRSLGEATEEFIGRRIIGMMKSLATGIMEAQELLETGNTIEALMKFAVTLETYKYFEALEGVIEGGLGGILGRATGTNVRGTAVAASAGPDFGVGRAHEESTGRQTGGTPADVGTGRQTTPAAAGGQYLAATINIGNEQLGTYIVPIAIREAENVHRQAVEAATGQE